MVVFGALYTCTLTTVTIHWSLSSWGDEASRELWLVLQSVTMSCCLRYIVEVKMIRALDGIVGPCVYFLS